MKLIARNQVRGKVVGVSLAVAAFDLSVAHGVSARDRVELDVRYLSPSTNEYQLELGEVRLMADRREAPIWEVDIVVPPGAEMPAKWEDSLDNIARSIRFIFTSAAVRDPTELRGSRLRDALAAADTIAVDARVLNGPIGDGFWGTIEARPRLGDLPPDAYGFVSVVVDATPLHPWLAPRRSPCIDDKLVEIIALIDTRPASTLLEKLQREHDDAAIALARGEWRASLRRANAMLDLDRTAVLGWLDRGLALRRLGDLEEADAALLRASAGLAAGDDAHLPAESLAYQRLLLGPFIEFERCLLAAQRLGRDPDTAPCSRSSDTIESD